MIKRFTLLSLTLVLFAQAQAQTLRLRSNSLNNLHIVAIGKDDAGHTISKTLYDVSFGFWKTISLFDVKYGYDKYNNKEMQHQGYDHTAHWTQLVIFNNSNSRCDTLNISERAKNIHLDYSDLIARVSKSYDRNYVITDVVLNDEE
jgi:hypothetical protein